MMKKGEDAVIKTTKSVLTGARDIVAAIKLLRKPLKGWPVPLKGCITVDGEMKQLKSAGDSLHPFLVSKCPQPQIAAILIGKPEGSFLVWGPVKPDTFALSVVFQRKVSHHKLTVPDGAPAKVGKVTLRSEGLGAAIKELKQAKITGWPVRLTGHYTDVPSSKIEKTMNSPLGLTLEDKGGDFPGCFIKRIKEGSNADAAGGLTVGMRIVGIDSQDVSAKLKTEISGKLKEAGEAGKPIRITCI